MHLLYRQATHNSLRAYDGTEQTYSPTAAQASLRELVQRPPHAAGRDALPDWNIRLHLALDLPQGERLAELADGPRRRGTD